VQIAIFVSHSINEIAELCNKCFIMHHGEIIASGDTDTMIARYQKEILHLDGS
jgi:ABC-type polysaccharide/polyol phosphate transport system ATPase subunit